MSALQTRTNIAWLAAAAVVAVLSLPGVADASWRAVSATSSSSVRAAQDGACQAATARVGEASDAQLKRATLCLLNQTRERRGLPRLRLDARLSEAAERHSQDMVRRGYFAHDSLTGASFVDRVRRSGYLRSARSWAVGENLAWGSGARGTPEQILKAWMNSSGHRANILQRRFREVGIGVAAGAPLRVPASPLRVSLPAATYTTDFGFRN